MNHLLRQFLFRPLKVILSGDLSKSSLGKFYQSGPSGSILIVTLWVLIILSILSVALGNMVMARIKSAHFFIRQITSLPLAKAAYYNVFYGRAQENKKYDTENELLRLREVDCANNISYAYYFEDEGSRININSVSPEVLAKLPGLNKDLAKTIASSGLLPFKVKEEILLVDGIRKDSFAQFKDFITVYGDGKININTASAKVLSILGMEDDLINIIMRYRKEYEGTDGKKNTDDDGAFESTESILPELRKFEMLSMRQEEELLSIMNMLTVKSKYRRLKISTTIKGTQGNNYSIVMDMENGKILSWSEY